MAKLHPKHGNNGILAVYNKAVPKTDGVFTEIMEWKQTNMKQIVKREEIYACKNMFKPSIEWGGGGGQYIARRLSREVCSTF